MKYLSSRCCSTIFVTNSLSRQRQWVNSDTSCWKSSIKYSVFPSASPSSGISNRTGTQYSHKRSSNCCHFKKDILKQMPTNTLGTCVKSGSYSCLSSPSLPHSLDPPPYTQFCPPPLSPTHVPEAPFNFYPLPCRTPLTVSHVHYREPEGSVEVGRRKQRGTY